MDAARAFDVAERKPAYRTTAPLSMAPLGMGTDDEAHALCSVLGCSYQQLRTAVIAVGPSLDLVQDYLAAQYLMNQ